MSAHEPDLRLLVVALLAVLLGMTVCVATAAQAQTLPPGIDTVNTVTPTVAAQLAEAWTGNDLYAPEAAACVSAIDARGRAAALTEAVVSSAMPDSIVFRCPATAIGTLHTHPQQLCDPDYVKCRPFTWPVCKPSGIDLRSYRTTWLRFKYHWVQCGAARVSRYTRPEIPSP